MALKVKVINRKDNRYYSGSVVYIGRGSVLGNRFLIGKDGNRAEVILKYEKWLRASLAANKTKICNSMNDLLKKARRKRPLYLECFCKPLPCHGDVIKSILLEMDERSKVVTND